MVTFAAVKQACERFKLAEPITLDDLAYIKSAIKPVFPGEPIEVFRHKKEEPITVRVGSVVLKLAVS